MKIIPANIVTALDNQTVGTKVADIKKFFEVADSAIEKFDFASQEVPGQGFIMCPELIPCLSAGVGHRTDNPADYVLRTHRGRVEAFLRREHAVSCEGAALVVYTREAYLNDPDVQKDEVETARIEASAATHVLVAVLGFAGPKAPLSPYRLVHNLAGGNREAEKWAKETIHEKAAEALAYDTQWVVVAD